MLESQSWPNVLTALLAGEDLSVADAAWSMEQVIRGEATSAQIAAFLVALRAKGETVDEIVGFRDAILDHAVPLKVDPDGAGHRRHRGRPVRHRERVDDGLDRLRRRRHPGRSSTATGPRARRRAPRMSWRSSASTSPCPRSGSPTSSDPSRASPSPTPRHFTPASATRGDAQGTRHPDGLQLPRPALQPGPPGGLGRRRRQPRPGAAVRRRVPDPGRDGTGVPWRRRARRADDHGPQPRLGGVAWPRHRARHRSAGPRHRSGRR